MNGHVNSAAGAAGCDEGGKEEEETGAEDSAGYMDSETVAMGDNLEPVGILDDDSEQPDGQRSSLSLDDDGGAYFEPHSQDTVIRQALHVQDGNVSSCTLQEASDDNDIVFNPVQRLHFDNDGEDEDYDDNDNEDSLEVVTDTVDNSTVGNREYLPHRRVVNGSDMTEQGAYGGLAIAQDQVQNVRIIEGHDSSLLDDSSGAFGFNFLQPQMAHLPLMSPINLNSGNSSRMEDEAHNLYDSLEREDGSSLYEETDDHVIENNTSEYFGAGSMSLVVSNSQVPDCDSLWAQDDSSDHGSYLPHSQQHPHSGQGIEQNFSRNQSPLRNFQMDISGLFVPKRRGDGIIGDGVMGGYGDVRDVEDDNTDALTLELSEEGLSHTTQMYAQPVSASSIATAPTTVGNGAQIQNDRINSRLLAQNNSQFCIFNNRSVHQIASDSLPRNLALNQGLPKNDLNASSHVEGDGVDVHLDERQAGAGSFFASDQRPTGDSNPPSRRQAVSKIHTRRPAVQGSASSGENRKSLAVNPRQNATVIRKTVPPIKSGSHSDANGRGNMAVVRRSTGIEQVKGNNSGVSSGSNVQPRVPPGHMFDFSIASRSNSHTSLASNVSSTNSRVGGVGKESHMSTNTQITTRGAAPFVARSESSHPVTMAQRLASGVGDNGHTLVHTTHSGAVNPQQNYQPLPQFPSSSDRTHPALGPQVEPNKSQAFIKQRSAGTHIQNPQNIVDPSHDLHNCRSGDPSLTQGFNDIQLHSGTVGIESRNKKLQGQNQQQSHNIQQSLPNQHLDYGGHHLPHQNYHAGFFIQSTNNQESSLSGSEGNYHNIREPVVTQMEAFQRQGPRPSSGDLHSQRPHLDNDIQGMEEVRNHLHSMLHMGAEASLPGQSTHDHLDVSADPLASDQSLNHHLYFDTDSSSFIGNSHHNDMSDILENFPTFSSKIFSDMPILTNRSESVSHGENQYLRDTLEKERYRRKHCEEHIQKQNTKLLELQQQLAVAVSTDKRKDLMIEQLDKQLAKVVEGWKKRETEKDELLKALSQEKQHMEESLHSQQTVMNNLEQQLSLIAEELKKEKERAAEMINSLKTELSEAQKEKDNVEATLNAERKKHASVIAEWENLKASRDLADQRATQAQERLIQEQENWFKKEQSLLGKITEVQETNQRTLNLEKVKFEEQKKKREEAEADNEEMKSELKKVILDMEQLIREKESQKVEIAIMEAKFENAQRKLEADLHAQMEKEIADQAAEFHSRIETSLEEVAGRHRKQVAELQSRHQRDLERQAATLNEERQKKEEDYRRQLKELEEKLQEVRTENLALGQSKIKLESQRMEILTKLQYMMQSQWNEAVSLLVTTPQKRSLNGSFLSNQSSGQPASATAVTGSSTSVTSLGLVPTGSVMRKLDSGNQGHDNSETPRHPTTVSTVILENGKGERQEERERMDRVEEYLQRLPQNMDIPVMRNETAARSQLPQSEVNQGSGPDSTAANNSTSDNYNNMLMQQHHSSGNVSAQETGGDDFLVKPSNNLSQSRLSYTHAGYVAGPSLKTLVTVSGHVARPEPRYQAVAMRSPQQSSSRYSSDSSQNSATAVADQSAAIPPNQHFVFNSHPVQGFTPPHRHQSYHTHHHNEQKSQRSPQQQHPAYFSSSSHGRGVRPMTGDFGDHKEVKLTSSSVANINLFRPDSPSCISSPAGHTTNHWSPASNVTIQHYPSVPSLTAGSISSPGQAASSQALFSAESPVKRRRPKTNQQTAQSDNVKENLSPPVKQPAERDHSDSASDASSGSLDASRLVTNYSQLSSHMEDHQNRQGELQHYVRMLLQKAPGSVCSEPERDRQYSDPEILESSRDLTVDLDLTDTATAAELTSQLTRLQQLREREQLVIQRFREKEMQASRTMVGKNPRMQPPPTNSQSNESILSQLSELFDDTGIISSQRLSEISKLLNLYRDPEIAGQVNVTSQLLDALKEATASASTENVSGKDDRKLQEARMSPKSQQTRKVKDLTQARRVRSESQSGDSSLAVSGCSLDSTTSSKPVAHGPPRKGSQPMEHIKDKKTGTVKHPGGKSSGGPAWK